MSNYGGTLTLSQRERCGRGLVRWATTTPRRRSTVKLFGGTDSALVKAGTGTLTLAGTRFLQLFRRHGLKERHACRGPFLYNNVLSYSTLDAEGCAVLSCGTLSGGTGGVVYLGGLKGSGNLAPDNTVVALVVGNNNLWTTYSGVLSGSSLSLQKNGYGTLTLSGANTFGGTTTVYGGGPGRASFGERIGPAEQHVLPPTAAVS